MEAAINFMQDSGSNLCMLHEKIKIDIVKG
jgi:hypothetical protein